MPHLWASLQINRGLAFSGNFLSTPLNFVMLGLCLMQYVLRKQWAFTPNNLYKCVQLIKCFLNQISALHNIKGATLEASNNRNQFIQAHYPRKLECTFKSVTSGSWGTRKTRRKKGGCSVTMNRDDEGGFPHPCTCRHCFPLQTIAMDLPHPGPDIYFFSDWLMASL